MDERGNISNRDGGDRFEALFRNVPEPIVEYVMTESEPVVLSVNPAFEETFGYDAETIVGDSLDNWIVPENRAAEARSLNQRVLAGDQLDAEVRRRTTEGDQDFLLRNAGLPSSDGRVRGYVIYVDITDRKEYERVVARLHDSTRELMVAETPTEIGRIGVDTAREVLGFPYSSVHLYDESEGELYPVANTDEARQEFGPAPTFEPSQGIAGEAFSTGETIHLADAQLEDRKWEEGSDTIRGYCVVPLGNQGIFTISSPTVGAITDRDVEVINVLAANMESAFRRADRERELRQREREVARQNKRLERFASVVSHDLRNPIEVANVRINFLQEECDSHHLDEIEVAIDRMSELIEESLTLARQGETVAEPDQVQLGEVVRLAWGTIDTSDASLTIDVPDDYALLADKPRLQQLLENVFRNAVHHGGPRVSVVVTVANDGTTIVIEDDGPGLPVGAREHVFEVGFSTTDSGTGLGLNIVEEIARSHDWTVSIGESDSGGARIEINGVEPV